MLDRNRTRGHGWKIEAWMSQMDVRKHFFSVSYKQVEKVKKGNKEEGSEGLAIGNCLLKDRARDLRSFLQAPAVYLNMLNN